jgi:uncharacterized protein YggU (UPF0235/DUF167 family)
MNKTIQIIVKTKKQKNLVEFKDKKYTVYTKSPAKDNKANISVIEQLSDYFDIPKRNITIKRGLKSKNKIVEIEI